MKRPLMRTWKYIPDALDNKSQKPKEQIVFTLIQPSYEEFTNFLQVPKDLDKMEPEVRKKEDEEKTNNALNKFVENIEGLDVEGLDLKKGSFSKLKKMSGSTVLIKEIVNQIYISAFVEPDPLSKSSVTT